MNPWPRECHSRALPLSYGPASVPASRASAGTFSASPVAGFLVFYDPRDLRFERLCVGNREVGRGTCPSGSPRCRLWRASPLAGSSGEAGRRALACAMKPLPEMAHADGLLGAPEEIARGIVARSRPRDNVSPAGTSVLARARSFAPARRSEFRVLSHGR